MTDRPTATSKRYAELLTEQRRRVILDILQRDGVHQANDRVLRSVIESALSVTTLDLVRADLVFLESHLLVRIERLDEADIWVARLTDAGSAVARGVAHVGVADKALS